MLVPFAGGLICCSSWPDVMASGGLVQQQHQSLLLKQRHSRSSSKGSVHVSLSVHQLGM